MSPEAFTRWLAEMHAAKLAETEEDCGRLLGIHQNSVTNMKKRGASQAVALACRALLHRMEPYG